VPNPNLTIRNFFIAVQQPRAGAGCQVLPRPVLF
jgi:hypothetical protein